MSERISAKDFTMRILNATAISIVVALIPNAVLGGLFQYLGATLPVFLTAAAVCANIQWLIAPMIGFLAGLQFKFSPMKCAVIAAAAWTSSGALTPLPGGTFKVGIGDLINVMLFTALACWVTLKLGDKFGSLIIILQCMVVGAGVGLLGALALPYVSYISQSVGNTINYFTTLQPMLMCILIAMSFSVLIICPISTVAIALAIGLAGLSSGAANIGVAATASVLVVGSWRVNKAGVTMAVGLGAMKMMMPNLVKHPIMLLPVLVTSAVSGIAVRCFGILGDKVSAGFGYVGLIGPIKATSEFTKNGLSTTHALLNVIFVYFVVTFGVALIAHFLFTKVLKIYNAEIYKFEG